MVYSFFRSPAFLLMLMAAAMQFSFASWSALQYNFASEVLDFTGAHFGLQQSIREIPGFLSFAAVFLLFIWREQTIALISLTLLALGVAATGYFPTALGFYITTFIGSIGFHYYETMNQSLTLQWLSKGEAAKIMGRIIGVAGFASLASYAAIFFIGTWANASFQFLFLLAGLITFVLVIYMYFIFPNFKAKQKQKRQIIIRKAYWLYYILTFLTGARRQIFLVFAGWMMVERFGYAFKDIAALFLINAALVMILSPFVGILIQRIGDRRSLMIEYVSLICVFVAYAFVQNPFVAICLYIIDHIFFSFEIALKTYFQKIAKPSDIAASTGVAFTINHIAAVFIPVFFGLLWLFSPAFVFLIGAFMAFISLCFSFCVPVLPSRELGWINPLSFLRMG